MGKYKKPAIRNKKKLVDEISDPEMAYMKRQLEILKADNERLRKERLKNDQNSSKTLALTVASIGKNSKAKHINNHKKSNKEISDSETNISNNQKVYKYNKTRKIINVSENSETDELTYKQVLKKRKHRKNKQANKVTTISSDSETNNEQILLKKYKKKINDNESDIEDMSISQKTKTPIAKPTNLKWYDLPKLLSLDNKVYASYRSAMREFIAEKWNGNTPEYRKISMTKKRYLVEKHKSNNPDFPLSIGDWAIQMMMRRAINQQRKVERKVTKNVKHSRVMKSKVMVAKTNKSNKIHDSVSEDADATNDEDADTNNDEDADTNNNEDANTNNDEDANTNNDEDSDTNNDEDADTNNDEDADTNNDEDADTEEDANINNGEDAGNVEDTDTTNYEDANSVNDNKNTNSNTNNNKYKDDSRSINKKLDTKKSRRILKMRQDIVNSNNSEIQKSKYGRKVNNSKRSMQEADQGEDTQENQKSNRRSKRIANKLANSNT
ncbi:uncharacterized protein OCT59_015873 [Rhizophagus irregularis]|uniref:uncharacterized protein n=1 Tax=Rhizophagus irregularis TaxID=588596 RepID=UPI0019DC0E20|nr:hypothetical protein OCT59_015873 [Rhizophagus irregularis]GBC30720.2 hypothetical protein GLOIN_2v1844288 [Rhizophagus irregularis DAOM 181602=DAOM 197198]